MLKIILCTLSCACSFSVHAEEKKPAHKRFDVNRMMHIAYGSTGWNTDSTKIDTAYLILRDKNSGKIVRIQLEETEPDSSQFTGQFSININDQTTISPEIYIPPKEMRGNEKDYKKLYEMIQAGKLPRKPVIMKKNEKGHSIIDVYDTREQAEAALKAYEQEQKLAKEIRKEQILKKINNEAAMAAAAEAERKAKLQQLAVEAAQREQERLRLEQIERQKAVDRAEALKRMTEQQLAERRARAAKLDDEALALYNQGEFEQAEGKFKEAVDLDPENKSYAYKYGITLYRLNKFNPALVALKVSKVDPAVETEKEYYMGLVYYRLGELDNAYKQFQTVAKSKDPQLGPAGLFYSGVILFAQEKYDASKKAFETVIDTSQDPKLDAQADEYLDRIASAMAWQKLRENRFTFTAVVGAMYDSNVLLTPTSTPSNSADARLNTLFDLQYRPIFSEKNQWTPHATVNLTNSAKNSSAPGDPFLYTLAAPYTYAGKSFSKDWKITATPGYELLWMDPKGTGTKSEEMASSYLTLDNTFVVSPKWISLYTLEYRYDNSYDPSSVGPSDLTSNKYTLRTVQTTFVDSARKQALMPSLGYIRNNAKGSDKTYNRYDIGATYVRPVSYGMSWSLGLSYYQQNYINTTAPHRVDNDYTVATGVSKPIKSWLTWGLLGTYTKNDSSDPTYEYVKYLILTTATITTNF